MEVSTRTIILTLKLGRVIWLHVRMHKAVLSITCLQEM